MGRNDPHLAESIEALDLRSRRDRVGSSPGRGSGRVTVVLAGDNAPARSGVRSGLEHHGFSVVAEAADANEAVAAALLHRPQVCLLHVDMPGGGIDAADRIYSSLPETKIAMLASALARDEMCDAIRAGADGYLSKSTAPDKLTAALNGLLNGEAAVPRALTGHVVHELRIAMPATEWHVPSAGDPDLEPRSSIRYVPRLLRHFRRRQRSGMPVGDAWRSARARMREYG